ncbi:MAG: DegT/DnrJ/EryC1/StrS family aminotransferase [Candidatus Omnitrophica bacterium]|nr:DegT/DnrJ/EryC1/StrS family aminotransferase [Candidatus Omnitrophota bacterium]
MKYNLNEPFLEGKEEDYLLDVLRSKWLSTKGKHTRIFEEKIAARSGLKYALAVQSGTAAIHTAAMALGLKKGDKVIVPNYTCAGSIVGIVQCQAAPVLLDIEPDTFGLDAALVRKYIDRVKPAALMVVHIYGFPSRDTEEIADICRRKGIALIEDCSEALGAKINNRSVGTYGDIATYSIRSEKMIGVGEGGVVATNSRGLLDKAFYWASRAAPYRTDKDPYWKTYYYTGVGMNYLLPHLLGAVARAQIENFDRILKRKISVGRRYQELLGGMEGLRMQQLVRGHQPVFWLNIILLEQLSEEKVRRLGEDLIASGVQIRPGFWPLSDLPPFGKMRRGAQETGMRVLKKGIVLPSSVYLADDHCRKVDEVVKILATRLKNYI